ncbi:unnamed protein product [Closterium sp. NIES-53]
MVTRKLMHAFALLSLALAATATTPRLLVAAAAAPPSPDKAALLALRDVLRRSNPAALPEWGNAMNPCDPSLWSPRLKCNSDRRVISL